MLPREAPEYPNLRSSSIALSLVDVLKYLSSITVQNPYLRESWFLSSQQVGHPQYTYEVVVSFVSEKIV